MKNKFEESIKESLESYELPYEPSGWKDMERRLNKSVAADHSWLVALGAACLFAASGTWVIYNTQFRKTTALAGYNQPRAVFQSTQDSALSENTTNYSTDTNTEAVPSAESVTAENSTLHNGNNVLGSRNKNSANSTDSSASHSANATANAGQTTQVAENTSTTENNTANKSGRSVLTVEASITETCAGNEVDFALNNGPKDGSYLWNFGDGNFSNKPNPKHKYDKPGTYDVSLSVTNKKDGQIATSVMEDFVTIYPAPNADFEWEFVNAAYDEPTVKIVNTSENANAYKWTFEDGTSSKAISPTRSYTDKGKQIIALEVSNAYGCKDNKVKYININNDYNLMAPDRIQIGKDVFMPDALKQGKFNFKLTVYNGEKSIYETTQKNKGWDGKLPDGTNAVSGKAYPWIVIIYNEKTNEEKYFSGTVTVNP